MTTVVNTPGTGGGSDNSGVGIIVGVIALVIVVGLFYVYVLPSIQNPKAPADSTTNINVQLHPKPVTY